MTHIPIYWKRRTGRVFERCGEVTTYNGKRYAMFRPMDAVDEGRLMALHKMQPASSEEILEAALSKHCCAGCRRSLLTARAMEMRGGSYWHHECAPPIHSENYMSTAANEIERGLAVVHIRLSWGAIVWRASTQEIQGASSAGMPFTIAHIEPTPLMRWLRGAMIEEVFPNMSDEDCSLLVTGKPNGYTRSLAPLFPACAPHPGEIVKDYLDARGWTERDFAIATRMLPSVIRRLCAGEIPMTTEIATIIAPVLQRPAQLWMNLQRQYDERLEGAR